MPYDVLPAVNDQTQYDAARDQHIQAGIAAVTTVVDGLAGNAEVILIDTAASLPPGTPVNTVVVVKSP
jgi:hypothetical protein